MIWSKVRIKNDWDAVFQITGKLFPLLPPRSTHLSACFVWGLARDDIFGVGAPILSLENPVRQVWQVIWMLHRMVSDGDALMKPPECSIEFILRRGILLYDAIRKFPQIRTCPRGRFKVKQLDPLVVGQQHLFEFCSFRVKYSELTGVQ